MSEKRTLEIIAGALVRLLDLELRRVESIHPTDYISTLWDLRRFVNSSLEALPVDFLMEDD